LLILFKLAIKKILFMALFVQFVQSKEKTERKLNLSGIINQASGCF